MLKIILRRDLMSKIFRISTLFSILSFLWPYCFSAERDYLKDQKGGVWRISLDIHAEGQQFGHSQEEIHSELKKQTVRHRCELECLKKANKVKGALGNCASCRVQFVFSDNKDVTEDINNGREVVDNFSMTGFSTLRKSKGAGGGLVSCGPGALESVRNWLFSEGAPQRTEFYTDTEIQIIGRLFCQGVLNDFIERYAVRNIRAVIIHIYTEDDPCGWCAQALYNVFLKVQNDPQQAELARMLRNGTKLIFEVSSTRQHLHAREFGCDSDYLKGTPIQVDLNEVQTQPLVFFSRFSDREIVQETTICYNKSRVGSGKAAVLNVSEAQPEVRLSTREDVDGCVREVKLGVLREKGTLLSKSFIFGRHPVSEQEFNQEIEKIQGKSVDWTVRCEVGNRIEEKFWLKPVSHEGRRAAAKAQYDRSIFHIHELEAQIAEKNEEIQRLEAEVAQLKALLEELKQTPPAPAPQPEPVVPAPKDPKDSSGS